jgi:hypothetical protein
MEIGISLQEISSEEIRERTRFHKYRCRYFPTPSKTTSLTSLTSQTSLDTVNQGQKEESKSELSEEKPSMLDAPGSSQKTVNSEVSEQSEVSLEGVASNAASLVRLTGLFEDKCVICGIRGRMEWQVNNHDGTWGLLCDRCGLELEKKLSRGDG